VGTAPIRILRTSDRSQVAQLLERDEFFWVDLAVAEAPQPEELAEIFGLSRAATEALTDFELGGPPSRRLHVDADGVVFPFWCVGRPDSELDAGGGTALGIFRVNVLLHGEFIATMRERPFDLTARVGDIPPGRSEGYAVYVVLDAITGTLVEALAAIEYRIGSFEEGAVDSSLREHMDDKEKVRNLRSRITTLRLRAGQSAALFQRVAEEVELIETLETERGDYTRRVQGQLDRTVSRIDATSDALTNALQVKLNETTYNLTLVASIFLPLTLIVGFFGMNFDWMVSHIDSAGAFWALGVGGMIVPLLAILLLVYFPRRQRRSSTTTGI
jgi:magnesium transporter